MKDSTQAAEIVRLEQEIEALEIELQAHKLKLPELATAWAVQSRGEKSENIASDNVWAVIAPTKVESEGGATLTRLEDGSYLASGKNPPNDSYRIAVAEPGQMVSGLLLEVFPDTSLPNQSLGRGFNGNFVMTDFTAELTGGRLQKPRAIAFKRTEADFAQAGWPAEDVLKNKGRAAAGANDRRGWAIEGNNPDLRIARKILFVEDQQSTIPEGNKIVISLKN